MFQRFIRISIALHGPVLLAEVATLVRRREQQPHGRGRSRRKGQSHDDVQRPQRTCPARTSPGLLSRPARAGIFPRGRFGGSAGGSLVVVCGGGSSGLQLRAAASDTDGFLALEPAAHGAIPAFPVATSATSDVLESEP